MTVSPELRARVIAMLRDGYGAEDIAVRLRQHVTLVRLAIGDLRRAGVFRQPAFFDSPAFGIPRRT